MKHIRKIMSAILALTLVLTSNIIPAMACTVEYDGHEPKVIPCEQVAEKGYCDTLLLHYGHIGGEMRPLVNPYYKDTAEVTETEPVATEAPVETTPVEEQRFADVAVTEVVPPKYDRVGDFSEGLAAVELDGKWGFVDKTGNEIVPCKYDGAGSFSEGLAAVRIGVYSDDKWGYIDKTGKEVVPPKYVEVENFSEGLAAVCIGVYPDYKWGFIDKTGKEVVPCKYDYAENFDQGLAMVRVGNSKTGKWGFIDTTGKEEVVSCKYDGAGSFSEGLARVRDENYKWGYIDKTGKEVVPCKYDLVYGFSEGFAAVELDGKWGFIDTTGKEVIPFAYDFLPDSYLPKFSEGLAVVCVDSMSDPKWGVIDTTGKEVVPLDKYYSVGDFSEGLAAVQGDSGEKNEYGWTIYKWGFIDTTGKEVVPCTLEYDSVGQLHDGLAAVRVGDWRTGKWGFISVSKAAAPVQTAKENVQTVKVDGKDVSFAMYSPDGGGTNYVRLVDLAVALNGTAGQYNVGYDGRVLLTSHTPYEGGTSTAPFHEPMTYTTLDEPTYVDGTAKNLEAIRFEYQNGGYTYYKLRDLGEALGFNVGWDNANQRIYIESNKPYDPNN